MVCVVLFLGICVRSSIESGIGEDVIEFDGIWLKCLNVDLEYEKAR